MVTQRYFQYIADANKENEEKLIPDIEGWCIFLGITKQTVLNYAKRSQDWADTIEYIKESILAAKKAKKRHAGKCLKKMKQDSL